jgi:hypothetical protein
VAIPDAKGRTIARAFLNNCYFRYGGCTEILTDNATSFTSDFFRELCSLLYINKSYSIPHWSQGNSVTERTFRTFHNILSKYISKEDPDFDEFLDCASFCYNTSVHSSTGETPYFLMFGRDPLFAIDQILDSRVHKTSEIIDYNDFKQKLVLNLRTAWTEAAKRIEIAQNKGADQYDKKLKILKIEVGDRVLLRNYAGKIGTSKKFHLPWKGIFRVIGIDGINVTIISCLSPQAKPKTVHINQIKKCFEQLGPACTLPNLPADEQQALEEAEANEIVEPGLSHPEPEKAEQPIEVMPEVTAEFECPITAEAEETPKAAVVDNQKYSLRSRAHINKPKRFQK